jgi:hypothetical protein
MAKPARSVLDEAEHSAMLTPTGTPSQPASQRGYRPAKMLDHWWGVPPAANSVNEITNQAKLPGSWRSPPDSVDIAHKRALSP